MQTQRKKTDSAKTKGGERRGEGTGAKGVLELANHAVW